MMKKRILAALLLLCLMLCGCSGGKGDWSQITAAINVAQGGQVVVLGSAYYHIEDQLYINQTDIRSGQTRTMLSDKYIRLLCSDGKKLYYSVDLPDSDKEYVICSFNPKNSQRTTLIRMEGAPTLLSCSGNHLFYLRKGSLCTFDLKTKSETILVESGVQAFTCAPKGIYYATLEGLGEIYYLSKPGAEPVQICTLPFDFYQTASIDQMFVAKNTLYLRKRWNLESYNTLYTSTSYRFTLANARKVEGYISVEDMHGQFPVPDGSGHYFIFALTEDSDKRAFQRFYSGRDSNFTYLASYDAGLLGYCPKGSDWINTVESDYQYFSDFYYTPDGLLLMPSYQDSYIFYRFGQ